MRLPEIEKLAVEIAELAGRESQLAADLARISEELTTVRAAKSERLQRLASGGNGAAGIPAADTSKHVGSDAKEKVYRLITGEPSRAFGTVEVHKVLGLPRSSASVYLSQLAKAGRIAHLPGGKYRALANANTSTPLPVQDDTEAAWPAKIVSLLATAPRKIFAAPDIAKHFGVTDSASVNTIRGALSRLHRNAKISKTGHGGYRAIAPELVED